MFSIQNVHSYFLDPVDVAAASFADAAAVAAVAAVAAAADAAADTAADPADADAAADAAAADPAAADPADAAAAVAVAAVAAAAVVATADAADDVVADAAVALLCSPISPTLNGPISQRRQKLDCIFSQWLQCHYTAHIMVEMDSVTRFSTLLLIKALQYTWITYTVECR